MHELCKEFFLMPKTLVHVQQGLPVGAREDRYNPNEPLQLGIGPALKPPHAEALYVHLQGHLFDNQLATSCELITLREHLPPVSQPHTLIKIAGYTGLMGATIGDRSSTLPNFAEAKLIAMGYDVHTDDLLYPTKPMLGLFVVQRY
jgi:hypothetical protein